MVRKTFQEYLSHDKCTFSCVNCRAHLADHDDLISKSFQGSQGRAYLFNNVINVGTGPAEERYLLTGLHAVADIYCKSCKTSLGWKYEHAFESSQKYKEGKYIIELIYLIKDNGWSNGGEHLKGTFKKSPSICSYSHSPSSDDATSKFNWFNKTWFNNKSTLPKVA
jgi:hypothetical protein